MIFNFNKRLMLIGVALMIVPGCHRHRIPQTVASNLKNIEKAERSYQAKSGGQYAGFPQLISNGLLDTRYLSCHEGYCYSLVVSGTHFTAFATPIDSNGKTGVVSVSVDGKLRRLPPQPDPGRSAPVSPGRL